MRESSSLSFAMRVRTRRRSSSIFRSPAPPGFARLLRILRPAGGVTQYKWPDKSLAKSIAHEFEALRQNVVKPALAEWQLALHERIYAVLRPALQHLAAQRAGNGPFTYADLLLATRDLLRDFPAVRRTFAG